jgi:hypothetical protein
MKENTGKENLKEWFSEFEMHLMEDEALPTILSICWIPGVFQNRSVFNDIQV